MGSHIKINKQDKANICRIYGFSTIEFHEVESGIANSTYIMVTDKGKFVITIFEDGEGNAIHNKQTLRDLAKHNFPSPRIALRQDGMEDLIIAGKPTMITHFIEAKPFKELPDDVLGKAAFMLYVLHSDVPPSDPVNTRVIPSWWKDDARLRDPSVRSLIRQVLDENMSWENLENVRIHGDPFADNFLLLENHELILLDWAESTTAPAVIDIAMALIGNCMEVRYDDPEFPDMPQRYIDPRRAKIVLDAYQSLSPLSAEEKAALPSALKYATTVLVYKRYSNKSLLGTPKEFYYRELLNLADNLPQNYIDLVTPPEIGLSLDLH